MAKTDNQETKHYVEDTTTDSPAGEVMAASKLGQLLTDLATEIAKVDEQLNRIGYELDYTVEVGIKDL